MEHSEELRVKTEERPRFSPAQKAAAWVALVLCIGAARLLTVPEPGIGIFIFALGIYGATAAFVFKRGVPGAKSAVIPTLALVLAAGCFFTTVPVLRALTVLALCIMYVYWVFCALSGSEEGFPGELAFFELLKGAFVLPLPSMGTLWPALLQKRRGKNSRTVAWILAGVALAAVPTAVIVALLSYDSAFTGLLEKITGLDVLRNLFSNIYCVFLGVPLAMYVFGLLYAGENRLRSGMLSPETSRRAVRAMRFAPSPLVAAALTPALAVYVIFFISQWDNYVFAFTGLKPENVSFADYARNGFFELCAVAAINALMVLAATLFMKRAKEKAPLLRIYCGVYSVFTLVLIATALSKMALYIGEYGLTRLRLLTSCFMVMLALCFGALLLAQFLRRIRLVGVFAAAAVLTLGAVSFTNVDGSIARYNTEAYLSGNLGQIDVSHFYELGPAAVPEAVKLASAGDIDPAVRTDAVNYLDDMASDLRFREEHRTPFERLLGLSLPGIRARAALEEGGYLDPPDAVNE